MATGHRLEPVADPEDRYVGVEDALVDLRCTSRIDRLRPAAEDHRFRLAGEDFGGRHRVRDDLGVHPSLTDAARDQLRVLRSEVDDEDEVMVGGQTSKPLR